MKIALSISTESLYVSCYSVKVLSVTCERFTLGLYTFPNRFKWEDLPGCRTLQVRRSCCFVADKSVARRKERWFSVLFFNPIPIPCSFLRESLWGFCFGQCRRADPIPKPPRHHDCLGRFGALEVGSGGLLPCHGTMPPLGWSCLWPQARGVHWCTRP